MTSLILSYLLVFTVGLGIGLGTGCLFWRRQRREIEHYLQRVEGSRNDKVERYQASLQRIKEREAKIGELRKEIYHQEQVIRELETRLEGHHQEGRDQWRSYAKSVPRK